MEPRPSGRAPANASTGLQVIVASAGSSGSTSVHAALEAMGLRTYGSEEFIFYLRDLPLDRIPEIDWAGPESPLKACGVQAVVADLILMPVVWQLLPRSPDAKVMLLTSSWQSWIASKRRTLERGAKSQILVRMVSLLFLCHWLPYGLVWPRVEVGASFMRSTNGSGITMELLDYCIAPFRMMTVARQGGFKAHRQQFRDTLARLTGSEEAYREFQDKVRQASSGSLLEAGVRDLGWESLAAHAGLPAPASGGLPRAKAGGYGKVLARMYTFPAKHLSFLGFALSSMVVHWLILWALLRAWRAFRRARRSKTE